MTGYLTVITKKNIDIYSWVLCFAVAYVTSFTLSGVYLPSPTLDHSYQVVLEYAITHGFQFGKDIIFTFGPFGFLDTTVSQGELPVQRFLFALAWSGIVAWSVTAVAQQIQGAIKYVFLVWFLVYSAPAGVEQYAFLVIAYGSMVLVNNVQKRKSEVLIFLTIFALLALIKFTLFMAAMATVLVCALVHIGKRDFRSFFTVTTFFGVILLVLWMAGGQKLGNLILWFMGSFEIARGFTEAMTITPKWSVFVICVIAGILFLISLWMTIQPARLDLRNIGILMVITANVFLSWKHSFVRADGHVMGFIFLLPMAFAILFTETFQKGMSRKYRLYLATAYIGTTILCNWAADLQEPGTMLTKLVNWPRHMAGNSRLILNSVTGKGETCFEALREKLKIQRVPDLPTARSIIGNSSVDVISYTQWAALANDMNYRPRPVIQGYSVYTPYLQDLNLSFYQSAQRPKYLLLKMETIDGRFPALDDATLLPYILSNYKPVAKDSGFLVLQSSLRDNHSKSILTLVQEQTITFGDTLNLPTYNNALLIMQVDIKPTLFGKITSFIFQSPILSLHTVTNGMKTSYRFIPAMAKRGLVISPLLRTNDDIMQYFSGAMIDRASSISFSKPKSAFGQLSDKISVKLYKSGIL